KAQANVERVLKLEEERFAETLDQGMRILEEAIGKLDGKTIPGETAFKLYDTYGFPIDLTADIARERDLLVDHAGFEVAMDEQRDRARTASQFGVDYNRDIEVKTETDFTGYAHVDGACNIKELFVDSNPVSSIDAGQKAIVILDQSPFYAESGGQVGDVGVLTTDSASFAVQDTQKQGNSILHIGKLESGSLSVSDTVQASIDKDNRDAIRRNHSATHLMHAALREVLGDHVQQKGSLCDAERLRFDFSHFEPVKPAELRQIERRVNQQIRHNSEANVNEMPIEEAKKSGAMALFGEKYADVVRVVSMGDKIDGRFSTELCGGTHVNRMGDIGFFKITAESGIASGVRRIEAVTGAGALAWAEEQEAQLDAIAEQLKTSRDEVGSKVEQMATRVREQEKQLAQLKAKLASQAGSDLTSQAEDINGVKILAVQLEGADSKTLRDTMDQLKNKLGSSAIVLASEEGGKVRLIAGVSKGLTNTIKAGDLVNVAAAEVGGKGGGRPDMAQAGGDKPENIPQALASAKAWLQTNL
ncbi:MAG: alanine--tRNA ligase, partial [Gammaproteobacteria bacterium]|nr:alanine--tRNA ligase [Gammaproteobacteria bacterium]